MRGVNKVILVGTLGADPDVRYMPNGDAVASVSLATNESWKDQQGNNQERTEWHRLILYRRRAEVAGEYLRKGAQIYVDGKLRTRKWKDQQGIERYTTEIIVDQMQMLGGKRDGQQQSPAQQQPAMNQRQPNPRQSQPSAPPNFDFDDDIPFAPLYLAHRAMHYAV